MIADAARPARPIFKPEAIPDALKGRAQWVPWRYELRGGKWTKPPMRVDGRLGSSTDPETRYPFPIAIEAYRTGNFDGCGFVLTAEDDFAAVDLDHAIDKRGFIEPWASEIATELQSYTEVSPSGRGLRIIVRAVLPAGRCRTGKFEVYDRARFVTITGDRLPPFHGVEIRQSEIEALHRRMFPVRVAAVNDAPPSPVDVDDADLISRACTARNGHHFAELFHGGGSDDRSAGDLALCNLLAFWTGRDPGRVDRLFRASGRMREKWDERRGALTYGAITIEKACASTREVYKP